MKGRFASLCVCVCAWGGARSRVCVCGGGGGKEGVARSRAVVPRFQTRESGYGGLFVFPPQCHTVPFVFSEEQKTKQKGAGGVGGGGKRPKFRGAVISGQTDDPTSFELNLTLCFFKSKPPVLFLCQLSNIALFPVSFLNLKSLHCGCVNLVQPSFA